MMVEVVRIEDGTHAAKARAGDGRRSQLRGDGQPRCGGAGQIMKCDADDAGRFARWPDGGNDVRCIPEDISLGVLACDLRAPLTFRVFSCSLCRPNRLTVPERWLGRTANGSECGFSLVDQTSGIRSGCGSARPVLAETQGCSCLSATIVLS
jgi:hypothetical protein